MPVAQAGAVYSAASRRALSGCALQQSGRALPRVDELLREGDADLRKEPFALQKGVQLHRLMVSGAMERAANRSDAFVQTTIALTEPIASPFAARHAAGQPAAPGEAGSGALLELRQLPVLRRYVRARRLCLVFCLQPRRCWTTVTTSLIMSTYTPPMARLPTGDPLSPQHTGSACASSWIWC